MARLVADQPALAVTSVSPSPALLIVRILGAFGLEAIIGVGLVLWCRIGNNHSAWWFRRASDHTVRAQDSGILARLRLLGLWLRWRICGSAAGGGSVHPCPVHLVPPDVDE